MSEETKYNNSNRFCLWSNDSATVKNKRPTHQGFLMIGDSIKLEISGWAGENNKTEWIAGTCKLEHGVEVSQEEKAIYDSLTAIMEIGQPRKN
jgi:hypothetical protein